MNKTKIEQLVELGKGAGFYVASYSPGDGVTRYRFFDCEEPCDYFEGYGCCTKLGFKEALAYAQGRRDGYFSREV